MEAKSLRMVLISGVVLCVLSPLFAAENHWTGAGGDAYWTNAANWSLGIVPDLSQDVFIDEIGTNAVILNASAEIGNFNLGTIGPARLDIVGGSMFCASAVIQNSSVLNLAGDFSAGVSLEVAGQVDWTSGKFAAPGGGIIDPTGNVIAHGTEAHVLGGTIVNNGTVTWVSTNLLSSDCAFTNNNLFVLETNVTLTFAGGGYSIPQFYNNGMVLAPDGIGTVGLTAGFNFTSQGTLRAENASVLEVRGSAEFLDGSVFEGAGVVRFPTNTDFMVPACQGTMTAICTIELDGGQIFLTSTWSGPGLFRWKSGTLANFTFAPDFQVEMSGAGDKISQGYCTNRGTVHWLDNASFIIANGSDASFNNYGQFILETNCVTGTAGSMFGGGTFNNQGTLTVPADHGALSLVAGCSVVNQGTIFVDVNSTLNLQPNQGSFNFQSGSAFDGAGVIRFPAGLGSFPSTCEGSMIVDGTVELDGGQIFLTSMWSGPGLFRWKSGTLANFTFAPDFQVEMSSAGDKIAQGSCTNFGTVHWLGDSSLLISAGSDASFNNYNQFILETNCALGMTGGLYGSSTFNNQGTLIVPVDHGAPLLSVGCLFANQGTVEADANSALQFETGGAGSVLFSGGSIFAGAGVIRLLNGAGFFSCDGSMEVDGTVELAGANLYLTSLWSGAGLFQWKSGTLSSFTFDANFHAVMSGSGDKFVQNACTNLGTLLWQADSTLSGNASLVNGGLLSIETNGTWSSSVAFTNLPGGIFRQTAGQFSMETFDNQGLMEFDRGILNVFQTFSSEVGSSCRFAIGGNAPGPDFGWMNVGLLIPGGSLIVALTNGFFPTNGSFFTIATDAGRIGKFASVTFPDSSPDQDWKLHYPPGSVTLEVASPTSLSGAKLLPDGTFQMTLTGATGDGYEILASTNLVDWVTAQTNGPFTGTLIFTDTDATNFSQRFYRARIGE
jgi:hypothetical protein